MEQRYKGTEKQKQSKEVMIISENKEEALYSRKQEVRIPQKKARKTVRRTVKRTVR